MLCSYRLGGTVQICRCLFGMTLHLSHSLLQPNICSHIDELFSHSKQIAHIFTRIMLPPSQLRDWSWSKTRRAGNVTFGWVSKLSNSTFKSQSKKCWLTSSFIWSLFHWFPPFCFLFTHYQWSRGDAVLLLIAITTLWMCVCLLWLTQKIQDLYDRLIHIYILEEMQQTLL